MTRDILALLFAAPFLIAGLIIMLAWAAWISPSTEDTDDV